MTEAKFKLGQKVTVWRNGKYVPAIIMSDGKWYGKGKCWGYEYQFDPYPKTDPITGISPSSGGWMSEHCIREIA